jgi:carbonic anhydrase/acetyltransferase-like protein (isoleucine patch superfamily)
MSTTPRIHETAFVHPLAYVAGDVTLGPRVSIWPFASIRGDTDAVTIGDDSNIQDGCVVHVDQGVPCHIGKRVGVGHKAIIHGATIEDDVLIAMGAIILNGARVGSGSIVGAGAVVREGFVIPPNSLVLGVPGRIARETTIQERDRIRRTVESYIELQKRYRQPR